MAVAPKTSAEKEAPAAAVPAVIQKPEKHSTLAQLERIVETKAARGATLWTEAATALLEIKDRKLWKQAKDANGFGYKNFVEYAEARFGFKKTYSYDLAKAAQRQQLAAKTEGEARAERAAERAPKSLTAEQAVRGIAKAFDKFEDRGGDLRDLAIEDEAFTKAYDAMIRRMGQAMQAFVERFTPIEGQAEDADEKTED